ncbi:putative redox protein [Paenibacillus cellulosilyticus]|uniref:Putative redox protein n=1 Tax=Paenibacillus cellulosilyticus TaxID=375489 RepID=A0A2V2Z111_9BACL|nr:OsmC family protein [Paenibacillus cellulosilyticus]PWW08765.1 putative redox protein [Paenibacillus cellulosilyticus]QKS48321.1 OsmC family protein [Paenibacillus cellulosilyticus]
MQVSTIWQGKRFFQATGPSGHTINMDATPAWGGQDKGASPVEVLLASLAGCIGIDVTMILEQFLPSIKSIEIITDGVRKEEAPKGFAAIELTFKVDGDIPDYRIWKAIQMGTEKYCSVSDSLNAVITHRLVLNGVEVHKE